MNVFPNLFVNSGSRDLMLRNPLGANRLEIWKTILVERDALPEVQREYVQASNRHFGPAGMFEQDDGENWEQSTDGAASPFAGDIDLNYSMGVGRDAFVFEPGAPPRIETLINEHAQLWMYRSWADYMSAASWAEYARDHVRVPTAPEGAA
jgi:hypothetical protein